MTITFLIITILFAATMSFSWSSNGWANSLVKATLSIYTLWAVLMLLGQLAPMINNGTLRLM